MQDDDNYITIKKFLYKDNKKVASSWLEKNVVFVSLDSIIVW